MKLYFISVLLLTILCACSSTKVKLISQGYSTDVIENLVSTLRQAGIETDISTVAIPKTFSDVTLAMNPSYRDLNQLDEIKVILAQQGFSVPQEFRFAQGKHFYTGNNIGLYLKNTNSVTHQPPSYLRTQYCPSADGTIQFLSDRKFVVEYENQGEDHLQRTGDESFHYIHGDYTFDGKELTLVLTDHSSHHYSFLQQNENTHLGPRPADILIPLDEHEKFSVLNCRFLIIYMDQQPNQGFD
ncbi:hypothetical protein ACOYR1_11230 [Thalassotalea piscium]